MEVKTTKRILFIGYNFSPELTGIGKYSGEMMYWLANDGNECTVLTAYPYYPYWEVQEPYRKNRFWYKKEVKLFDSGGRLNIVRCPMYVPRNPSGFKRMLLDSTFSIAVVFAMLPILFQKKYDWVISIAPTFQSGLLGVFFKKLKGGARHLHHIQDMQIEAAQDLGMIKSSGLLSFLYGLERYIFKHTDVVSSISEGMMARIERKAGKPLMFFPNWTETNSFFPLVDKGSLKEQFGYNITDWIVLYSGAIGEKQGLEAILNAAEALGSYSNLKFVICGTGPYKEVLRRKAEGMQLRNIRFMPLQAKEDFNAFLNMADLHLVIQKEKASDLVMPSKLTTILAVGGVALITANEDSTLFQIVRKHNMGLLVAAEDQNALNSGILKAYHRQDDIEVKKAARLYAEQFLAIDTVMQSLVEKLNT